MYGAIGLEAGVPIIARGPVTHLRADRANLLWGRQRTAGEQGKGETGVISTVVAVPAGYTDCGAVAGAAAEKPPSMTRGLYWEWVSRSITGTVFCVLSGIPASPRALMVAHRA